MAPRWTPRRDRAYSSLSWGFYFESLWPRAMHEPDAISFPRTRELIPPLPFFLLSWRIFEKLGGLGNFGRLFCGFEECWLYAGDRSNLRVFAGFTNGVFMREEVSVNAVARACGNWERAGWPRNNEVVFEEKFERVERVMSYEMFRNDWVVNKIYASLLIVKKWEINLLAKRLGTIFAN